MSVVQDLRTRARHRGLTPWQLIQKISRLERQADTMTCQLVAMATEIDGLKDERNQLQADFDAAAIDYSGALEDLRVCDAENEGLRREIARLEAELANRDAVTVPPMERDTTDGADQATAPIDVRPLREAAELGLLTPIVRISSTGASADPGRIPAA